MRLCFVMSENGFLILTVVPVILLSIWAGYRVTTIAMRPGAVALPAEP